MSTTVDERVVEMRFDNAQFEKNIKTSQDSVSNFQKGLLNLDKATSGFDSVNKSARRVDMTPLTDSVETVGLKFNALYTIADQVLRNITTSVASTAQRIAAMFTIEPLKTGFNEYELKMGSIQTIMAGTGEDLATVNEYLNELNEYSDKTIYSFADMTNNIGKFTNAGVKLDTAVSAIQGISNVAALSGANANEASRAMYNFSQALSSGYVKLIDWKSIENANMATVGFKEQLIETAVAMGTVKKQSDGTYKTLKGNTFSATKGFNDVLQDQWMTSEVLVKTLGKYSDETTDIGKKAFAAAQDVKTFSQMVDTLKESAQSGWAQTWEILFGDFEEGKSLWTGINNVLSEFIGNSAEARNELLSDWKTLGGRATLIEGLKNVFDGFVSIVKPIKEAFTDIFPPLTAKKLMQFTEGFKNLTEKFKIGEEVSDKLKRTFKGLFAIVDIIKQAFGGAFKAIKPLLGILGETGGGLLSSILGLTASWSDWLVNLSETIRSGGVFNRIATVMADVIGKAYSKIQEFVSAIKNGFSSIFKSFGDLKSGIADAADGAGFALKNSVFYKLIHSLWEAIVAIGKVFGNVLGKLFSGIINTLGNGDVAGFVDILNNIVSGGIGVALIQFIGKLGDVFDGASDALGGITGIFDGLGDCLQGFQSKLKADALFTIAKALALLAASLFVLALIDGDKMTDAISAITLLFAEMVGTLAILNKLKPTGIAQASNSLVKMGAALLLLAVAMKIMSSMSLQQMGIALLSVAVGIGLLVAAVNLLPDKKVKNAAKSIKTMSSALLILAIAMKIMGTMSWEEMGIALISVAVGLGLMVAAVNLLPKDTGLKVLGMVALATALVILGAALKIMGSMSWSELAVGLVALAGAMTILVIAMNAMITALPGAAAMLIVAPALVLLASALLILGQMSWKEMGVALVALAGSLIILAVAMTAMIAALPGAAAMLVVSAALAIFVPVLLLLGSVSWATIGQGLLALAASFAVIGIAGYLLAPIIPTILGLSAAILLFGAGCLAAGTGIMLLSVALSALAVSGAAGATALISIIVSVINLIPTFIAKIGEGIIALCNVIIEGAPAIMGALSTIIVSLCDAIIAATPKLIECLGVLLDHLLAFIVEYVPKIVNAAVQLIAGLLEGIAQNIGPVIEAGITLVIKLLEGIASQAVRLVAAGVDIVLKLIKGIASQVARFVKAGIDMMLDFINGLANAIRTYTPQVINAVNNLMSAVAEAIGMYIGNFPEMGRQIVSGLVKGIKSSGSSVKDALLSMAKDAWSAVKSFFGIKSPSRLAAEAGMYIDEGLAVGLKKYAKVASKAAVGMGETTMNGLNSAIGGIAGALNGDMDMNPTIRPVLDLSDVRSGASSISSIFGSGASVGVMANVGAINSMMNHRSQNGSNSDVVSAIDALRKDLDNKSFESININGVTYDDGSNITDAVRSIVRAARVERRM